MRPGKLVEEIGKHLTAKCPYCWGGTKIKNRHDRASLKVRCAVCGNDYFVRVRGGERESGVYKNLPKNN